jgi:ABC-type dipeptide/oligopeptide/nickel transport system permease subunit
MNASVFHLRFQKRFRFARNWSARIGLVLAGGVILLAVTGPFFAPYSPSALVGAPYAAPNSDFLFGTDFLGRDVFSRVLWGGRGVVVLAGVATVLAYMTGGAIGLAAGYSRSLVDPLLMRAMDVLLAFPPILFLLVLATGAGPSAAFLVLGIATVHVPSIARIVRAATLEVSVHGYVEAALARGEPTRAILMRQILPNIWNSILADVGLRFTVSILLVAAVNFLGLGVRPPAADWAIMISENRPGLTLQPWAAAVPAALIAALTIGTNLVADAIARSLGRSAEVDVIRR